MFYAQHLADFHPDRTATNNEFLTEAEKAKNLKLEKRKIAKKVVDKARNTRNKKKSQEEKRFQQELAAANN